MNTETLRKYAALLIEVGVNLQPGQKLLITAEPCHWDFVVLLSEVAYQKGAALVMPDVVDTRMLKARVNHADPSTLEESAAWIKNKYATMVDERWAKINFFGPSHPDLMGELDSAKSASIQRTAKMLAKPLSEACGSGAVSWCGAALPTAEWAAKVYGEPASEALLERLWQDMVSILRLDEDDPSAFWRQHGESIKQRCAKLESLKIDKLRFVGAGTDLTVACLPDSKWIGGGVSVEGTPPFIPNLPTEESFTTPDYRGTEGFAKVVRPVTVLGRSVVGAWFKFEQGKVVDYGADENKETLDAYFEMCPQAAYLGEVALVDTSSPIYQSGNVFHCILYDENASSHIALGSSYPMAVAGGLEMSREQLLEAGANVSLVHTDFMIGSPEVEIFGVTKDSEEISLIREGEFVV